MGGDTPGALVVTRICGMRHVGRGGRIAALSDPGEREELLAHAPPGPAAPDPGVGPADASVDLCGMGEQDLAVALAEQLGLPKPRGAGH